MSKKDDDHKILIIDENKKEREVLAGTLLRSGYTCGQATGGLQGISMMEQERFSLILIAAEMDQMGGVETLCHIRSLYPSGVLPIIIMAKDHDPELEKECKGFGSTDFTVVEQNRNIIIRLIVRHIEAFLKKNKGKKIKPKDNILGVKPAK
ncbi:MAG: response regulator [Bacteriovoracaceae bacterium]|jgi:CheY-like chemotaxis protein|nr:response regulator [Bacteriovoracaceae bacterium]